MAIGDAGAAKGLIIYPSTQDRRLGYQNDNQRADDVAATMGRLDTLEALPKVVGGNFQGSTDANGRVSVGHSLGVKPSAVVPVGSNNGAIPYATRFIVYATTTTTFTVVAVRDDGTADPRPFVNNAVGFHWVAIA